MPETPVEIKAAAIIAASNIIAAHKVATTASPSAMQNFFANRGAASMQSQVAELANAIIEEFEKPKA